MRFDPAIAAQRAFTRAKVAGELESDREEAKRAEARFSSTTGVAATEAYWTLQRIGTRHPEAKAFQAFCIYITWQQVTEETIPLHFKTGLDLCERFIQNAECRSAEDLLDLEQILELRAAFRRGLGLKAEDEEDGHDDDEDILKGGD
ncbi:MAG TPA: hypothetical protein VNK46_05420 [Nitrospiraceae bacterium]|jgi:hypothetical protein|nr:hypothetical protein [Nitrospiraceae bacterium]